MKYNVTISLDVIEVEADNEAQAEQMINQLIDELATVETSIPWDGCVGDIIIQLAVYGKEVWA